MTVHRFETVLGAEGSGVFIEIPLDVPALFGRARPAVRVTVNGHPFRSTVAVYGGRYYLPVKRALREAAGVAAAWSRPWPCSATAAGTREGQLGAESSRA
jgi:hypothetical protein